MPKRTGLAMHQSKEAGSNPDPDPDPETNSNNLIAEFEQGLARILRSGLTRKRAAPRTKRDGERLTIYPDRID